MVRRGPNQIFSVALLDSNDFLFILNKTLKETRQIVSEKEEREAQGNHRGGDWESEKIQGYYQSTMQLVLPLV